MGFLNTPNPESEAANTHKQLLQRTELIGGTTITTSIPPRNETVAQRFFDMLDSQIIEQGKVFLRPHVFLDEQNCFIPDVAIVRDLSKIQEDGIHGAPDFAIEIVVPATELILRSNKHQTYGKYGMKELWIADAQANIVESYLLDKGGATL